MKLIDKILTHYDSQGLLRVEVPEWADEEFDGVIFYYPMTLKARNEIMPIMRRDNLDFVAAVVARFALDREGKRLFDLEDEVRMRRGGDYNVLERLATQMMAGVTIPELGEE